MTIIERHADYLREHAAITAQVAEAAGIRSASVVRLPGLRATDTALA